MRAGDSSLHRQWIAGPDKPCFDLVVSYFGDNPAQFRWPQEARVDQKGGKWDGLASLFAARPELLQSYDYFWLPDDDIAADTSTINGVFAAMRRYDLTLAQPSLTLDSHYSYLAYLNCRSFALRYCDCIEIMAPCAHASVLRKFLPLIKNSPSGWGLDAVWTRLTSDNRCKSAILDQWRVQHTRPLGNALYTAMAQDGRSAWDDLKQLQTRFGALRLYPLVYEAVDLRGRCWKRQSAIGVRMALDYAFDRANIPNYAKGKNNILSVIRRQFFKKISLDEISDGDLKQ